MSVLGIKAGVYGMVGGQVIDIIMANTTKSFLYEYDSVVGGGNWFRYCLMNNSNAFASKYHAEVGMVNQLLSALVVAMFLAIPFWKGKIASSRLSKGGKANA